MEYVYYCRKCNEIECHDQISARIECSECWNDMIPLRISKDDWNKLSNEEMLSIIDKAGDGLKRPVRKTTSTAKVQKDSSQGRNKLWIPIILFLVTVIIIMAVVLLIYVSKSTSRPEKDAVTEKTEELASQEKPEEKNVSRKYDIDRVYSISKIIYEKGDNCAGMALKYWQVKNGYTTFNGLWDQGIYNDRISNSYVKQEVKDDLRTFWKYKQEIPDQISNVEGILKSITVIPPEEQAYYDAVKELYVMVSSYATQAITYPQGYNEIGYGEFVRSNRQQYESLKNRVELERK